MKHTTRALLPVLAALAAAFACVPANADVYKWVDENGVMHYSDKPPANPAHKAGAVADKISIYQSDPAATRALERTAAQMHADALARRVDQLEQEIAAQRRATQYASAADASQLAYEQCLADRRVDCNQMSGYGGGYGYGYGVPVYNGRRVLRRPAPFIPVANITGVTAGNVVTFGTQPAPRMTRGVSPR